MVPRHGRGRGADLPAPARVDRSNGSRCCAVVTAFLDVVLRGAGLSSQAIAVGGVLFVLLVLRPAGVTAAEIAPLVGRSLTLVAGCAVGVAIAQCLSLVLQLDALAGGDGSSSGWGGPGGLALHAARPSFRAS